MLKASCKLLEWLFIILLWQGCAPSTARLQVIYHGKTIENQRPDSTWVRSVQIRSSSYQLRVVTAQHETQWLSPSEVWGYRQANGQIFRLYQGAFYQVVKQGDLCVYVVEEFGDISRSNYYFSLTPDGDIWYLNRKNLIMAFDQYPCMRQFISQTRPSDWLKKREGTYGLAEAYQDCRYAATGVTPYP